MSRDSPLDVTATTPASKAKNGRSRATNHRDLLPRINDGRSTQARRFKDLVRAFISDAGGIDNVSEVRLGLLRRLAAATVLSEEVETAVVNGERVDINTFCTLASTTVRLAQRLGIERIPRNVIDLDPLTYAREAGGDVNG
jgi:hypothetical protein